MPRVLPHRRNGRLQVAQGLTQGQDEPVWTLWFKLRIHVLQPASHGLPGAQRSQGRARLPKPVARDDSLVQRAQSQGKENY